MALDQDVEQIGTEDEPTLEEQAEALEAIPAEEQEDAESNADAEQAEDGESEEEVSIGFDDEPAPDKEQGTDTPVLKAIRQENRQLVRRVRELESQLKAPTQAVAVEEDVGPEPTLADCNYDETDYKAKLLDWNARKATVERRKAEREEQSRKANEAYQAKLGTYRQQAAALGVKDFEDAEAQARDIFSPTQQGILVKHMTKPAALVYAFGKSEAGIKRAKELAAITDPIEFALAAAKLEDKHLKVSTPKKMAPAPEQAVRGSGKTQAVTSSNLERLKAEAQKTGDYTAYFEAKRRAQARQQT